MPDYPLEYLISPAAMPVRLALGALRLTHANGYASSPERVDNMSLFQQNFIYLANLPSTVDEPAELEFSSPDSLPFVLGPLLIWR